MSELEDRSVELIKSEQQKVKYIHFLLKKMNRMSKTYEAQ